MARLGFASGFCEVLGAQRAGIPEPIFLSLKEKWRGWDLNPEPMAYESTAPPLSYLAEQRTLILPELGIKVNRIGRIKALSSNIRTSKKDEGIAIPVHRETAAGLPGKQDYASSTSGGSRNRTYAHLIVNPNPYCIIQRVH